jgi:ABC-type phosphate transport system substrate-binding protein
MKYTVKPWFLALLMLTPVYNAAAQELVVIVNSGYEAADQLNESTIEQIFLGKRNVMRVYDLPDSSPLKRKFYNLATGRSIEQVKAMRAKLIFSGRFNEPEQLINSRAVKSVVASNPGAIGYVEKSVVDESVKVVLELGDSMSAIDSAVKLGRSLSDEHLVGRVLAFKNF